MFSLFLFSLHLKSLMTVIIPCSDESPLTWNAITVSLTAFSEAACIAKHSLFTSFLYQLPSTVCDHTHTHTYIFIGVCIWVYVYNIRHKHIYNIYIYNMYTHTYVCIYIYMRCVYVSVWVHIFMYTHTHRIVWLSPFDDFIKCLWSPLPTGIPLHVTGRPEKPPQKLWTILVLLTRL